MSLTRVVMSRMEPLTFVVLLAAATVGRSSLEDGFKAPPNSAKPRVWWHWMNRNITKEGIKLDLEWMNRVGIGGFQNFDASLGTPKLVDKRLVYMSGKTRSHSLPSLPIHSAFNCRRPLGSEFPS